MVMREVFNVKCEVGPPSREAPLLSYGTWHEPAQVLSRRVANDSLDTAFTMKRSKPSHRFSGWRFKCEPGARNVSPEPVSASPPPCCI